MFRYSYLYRIFSLTINHTEEDDFEPMPEVVCHLPLLTNSQQTSHVREKKKNVGGGDTQHYGTETQLRLRA